jgi:hypothetical protein
LQLTKCSINIESFFVSRFAALDIDNVDVLNYVLFNKMVRNVHGEDVIWEPELFPQFSGQYMSHISAVSLSSSLVFAGSSRNNCLLVLSVSYIVYHIKRNPIIILYGDTKMKSEAGPPPCNFLSQYPLSY